MLSLLKVVYISFIILSLLSITNLAHLSFIRMIFLIPFSKILKAYRSLFLSYPLTKPSYLAILMIQLVLFFIKSSASLLQEMQSNLIYETKAFFCTLFLLRHYLHVVNIHYLPFRLSFLSTQNPCLLRGLLKEISLMLKRHDHMTCLPSLLIMHHCLCFVNMPALVNVILAMWMSKNVWSPTCAESEFNRI